VIIIESEAALVRVHEYGKVMEHVSVVPAFVAAI
jgi:hypothetical protein